MIKIHKQVSWALLLTVLFSVSITSEKANAQNDTYVSYNDFYQNLAPYGQWIDDAQYGYVWSPNESGNFRPYYTNGHWVMTEYGNTWVSDYPWGWACFHYGRWTYDTYYGWLWIPGQDWGPAWVSWRQGEGYYGWAPLGPGYNDFGADYSCPNDWWVFIPPQYMYTGNYYHYWYGPRGNSRIIHNTTFVNHTYENNHVTYVSGPRSTEVEGVTHQPVQVYHLANSTSMNTRISNNNTVKMYRPAQVVPAATMGGQKVTPPNVVSAPQPVRSTPQAVNANQNATPIFRSSTAPTRVETPGTGYNQVATPAAPQRANANPYEYDVNRPMQQPTQNRQESNPQPTQNMRSEPAPQPARQAEQPRMQQPQMSAPQPQRQAPMAAPQQMRQAPAPAQAAPVRSAPGGGRR